MKFIKREAGRPKGFVFDPDFFLVGDCNIQTDGDRFFRALTGGDEPRFTMPPGAARREVSDHLPLWAEFRVTELEHALE